MTKLGQKLVYDHKIVSRTKFCKNKIPFFCILLINGLIVFLLEILNSLCGLKFMKFLKFK